MEDNAAAALGLGEGKRVSAMAEGAERNAAESIAGPVGIVVGTIEGVLLAAGRGNAAAAAEGMVVEDLQYGRALVGQGKTAELAVGMNIGVG